MKKIKIKMMLFSFIAVLGLGFAQYDVMAATASEAGNTATIEITEDWEPKSPKPEPKPEPKPKPKPEPEPEPEPPKKTLTLPQTGEQPTTYLVSGGALLLTAVLTTIMIKKRKPFN